VEEIIGNALIDMYAKCGSLDDALFIFEQMHVRSVAMWNTLISGFTSKGETDIIFHYFDKMTNNEQFLESEVTFLAILNACNHDGLLEKGQQVLMAMYEDYRTMLTIEHYNCIIDLLCRAGQLHEAVKVLEEMPLHPNMATWNAILAACQKSANVELGEWALESISRSDEKYIAAFIAMHNIYASAAVRGEEAQIG
jgi:pentatricopeptide repeat protein